MREPAGGASVARRPGVRPLPRPAPHRAGPRSRRRGRCPLESQTAIRCSPSARRHGTDSEPCSTGRRRRSLRRSRRRGSAGAWRRSRSRSTAATPRRSMTGGSPRCEEIPGYYATVRQDTREVLGIVGERYRIVQNDEAFQFVDQLLGSSIALRDRRQPARRAPRLGARDAARARRGRRRRGPALRAADEQPRRLDGGDRRDDPGPRGLPEHAQLGAPRRAAEVLDPPHRAITQPRARGAARAGALDRLLRAVQALPATSSPPSAAPSASCGASSMSSTRTGPRTRPSSRARRSREQTKERIAELFLHGETQGNAPGQQVGGGQRDRRVRRLAFARSAKAASASPARSTTAPRRPARLSWSRLPETSWPGGRRARRAIRHFMLLPL